MANSANQHEAELHQFPGETRDVQERESGWDRFMDGVNNFFANRGKKKTVSNNHEDLIDEILATEQITSLKSALRAEDHDRVSHDLDSAKGALQRYIAFQRFYLSRELTRPSWGPKIRKEPFSRQRKSKLKKNGLFSFGKSAEVEVDHNIILEPNTDINEETKAIAFNLEQSSRYFDFIWLYVGAALASVAVVIAALSVDYSILKEFWHQAMMNEYMVVPAELQSSVGLKALQVLFATIGIHLVLRNMPNWVVTTFTAGLFLMTVMMMIAVGFLYAHSSLNAENEATFKGQTTEDSGLFGSLEDAGVDVAGKSQSASGAEDGDGKVMQAFEWMFGSVGAESLNAIDAVARLVALTMIFLVVASIGALFMLWGEHNVKNFIIARRHIKRQHDTERLRLAEQVLLQVHGNPESSRQGNGGWV